MLWRSCVECCNFSRTNVVVQEETTVVVKPYTLPDGRVIKIGQERFQCAEVLFQPHLVDIDGQGIVQVRHP